MSFEHDVYDVECKMDWMDAWADIYADQQDALVDVFLDDPADLIDQVNQ
jgi:hypothetical protein